MLTTAGSVMVGGLLGFFLQAGGTVGKMGARGTRKGRLAHVGGGLTHAASRPPAEAAFPAAARSPQTAGGTGVAEAPLSGISLSFCICSIVTDRNLNENINKHGRVDTENSHV